MRFIFIVKDVTKFYSEERNYVNHLKTWPFVFSQNRKYLNYLKTWPSFFSDDRNYVNYLKARRFFSEESNHVNYLKARIFFFFAEDRIYVNYKRHDNLNVQRVLFVSVQLTMAAMADEILATEIVSAYFLFSLQLF